MSVTSIIMSILAGIIGGILSHIIINKGMAAEDFDRVLHWVTIAVAAAEKYMEGKSGEEKREYAGNVLKAAGIDIADTKIRAMVEAEVYWIEQNAVVGEVGQD